MKRMRSRRVFFAFALLFICMLHMPISLPKSFRADTAPGFSSAAFCSTGFVSRSAEVLYDSLRLNLLGLSREAYHYALAGLEKLSRSGEIVNNHIVSIADLSMPSASKRLFVIDLIQERLLYNTYVAHGQGSGEVVARHFSNRPSSLQSSLGFYETTDTYYGKHGYSLKLKGLESGFNDRASERAIVMHAAPYVNESYIRKRGCSGRSLGCPALPERWSRPIIEKIKNGTCLFIYGNDKRYVKHSPVLNS
jgi:hypothetical protein